MSVKSLNFENYTAADTSEGSFKNYLLNQNMITTETNTMFWQPETNYALGKIVRSSAMPAGMVAKCTHAGKSGTEEPNWQDVTTDNTVIWTLISEGLTPQQQEAANSGITAAKVAQYDAYGNTKQDKLSGTQQQAVDSGISEERLEEIENYPTTIPTGDNFNGAEVCHMQGSTAAIDINNGRIFFCSGSSITLPEAVDGVTITIISTASSVTWNGDIKWHNGSPPSFAGECHITTFIGYNGYWFGG